MTKYPEMFDVMFERTYKHEGGFQKMHNDRGNWTSGKVGVGELKGTKCGISAMTYPHLDIEQLTKEEIKDIYYHDWYNKLKLFRYCEPLQYQMFDTAFLQGTTASVKIFQRTVKTKADGIIGKNTLACAAKMSEPDKCIRFLAYRNLALAKLKQFDEYGRGWINRANNAGLFMADDNND